MMKFPMFCRGQLLPFETLVKSCSALGRQLVEMLPFIFFASLFFYPARILGATIALVSRSSSAWPSSLFERNLDQCPRPFCNASHPQPDYIETQRVYSICKTCTNPFGDTFWPSGGIQSLYKVAVWFGTYRRPGMSMEMFWPVQ